ncbi:MAG TPA: DOMON-like domain-containing protein [Burkholderiales bacterium]|nr:DOMON-like domain-containing protein [Burkholderiales bacterium]
MASSSALASPRTLTLTCHPQSRNSAVRDIQAHIARGSDDMLAIRYVLEADLDAIRIPEQRAPRHADRLWQHTCFELFIRAACAPNYVELNFSPSGEWAIYTFDQYRVPASLKTDRPAPRVAVRATRAALELEAAIQLDTMITPLNVNLAIAISAVIEDREGALSYWALAHPAGQPDFHHAVSFALTLSHH